VKNPVGNKHDTSQQLWEHLFARL